NDTAQEIGWGHEGTPETDAINNGSAKYWKIGVKLKDLIAEHPEHIVDYRPIYNSSKLYPSDAQRIATHGTGGWVYYPVNGIMLYLLFGGSSTLTSIHTVGGVSNILGPGGVQPWITIRSQMTGGTDDKFISAKGAKIQSVGSNVNFLSDWKYMTETITYNAIKTEAAAHAAAYSPVHPTDDYLMNGTPRTDRYCVNPDNTIFTWSGDNFLSEIAGLNIENVNHHRLGRIDNQTELEYIDLGNYTKIFTMSFTRGNVEEIWNDFKAGTQRTMVFKIYNGSTYYREYTWTKATLTKCNAPYTDLKETNLWTVSGFAEQLEIKIKDGVSDSFYDD
ncbi:hypothetical protein LCGC14_2955850, partial [marine sediment metagenome]